jgi:hypothetical protein
VTGKACSTYVQHKPTIVFTYFRKHEYRTYYNIDGELDEVVIIYSYRVRSGLGYMQDVNQGSLTGPATLGGQGARRFIKYQSNVKQLKKLTQKVSFRLINHTLWHPVKLKRLKIRLVLFLA